MHFYQRIAFAIVLLSSILFGQPDAVYSKADEAVLFVNPPTTQVGIGDEFEVRISVRDVVDLYAYELNINFPPEKLEVVSIEKGDFLEEWANPKNEIDNVAGLIEFDLTQGESSEPKNGNGDLLLITFKAKPGLMAGSAALQIHEDSILTEISELIPKSIENGLVFTDSTQKIFLPLIQK